MLKIIKINLFKKAQSLVEFALVLPLLVVIIMAIFEFGLLLKNYLGLNYALNKALKEAYYCRGQINADIKVIKKFLENSFVLNTKNLVFISSTNKLYGPYKLENGKIKNFNNEEITTIDENLFFFNDNNTPTNESDDIAVNPINSSLPSYAKIKVRYQHTLLHAQILGLTNYGTFNLILTSNIRVAL